MGNRRPRLLFLAHRFPPARAIACVRTWNIAKYLARLGWDLTVVTPHPSVWLHMENPENTVANLKKEGIRRILTDHRWHCLLPDHLKCWNENLGWLAGGICRTVARYLDIDKGIGWIKAAERACAHLTPQDVDVIFATGAPFSAFKLAKRLSDRLGRPYVLDYRDPWTGNPHRARPARAVVIEEESRLLGACAAATVVSHSWKLAMERRFSLGKKLQVVTNGYDPEDFVNVKPYHFGHFAIVYTGALNPPKRVIGPLIAALQRLEETVRDGKSQWYFHYYGPNENLVREEAVRFGVTERVVLHGSVPRAEALSAVRGAGVAVAITSVGDEVTMEDQGIVPGKIFEALGLGTPLLVIAPSASDVEDIAETTGLVRTFTASDIDGMASFLAQSISGHVLKPRHLEDYAWPNIAKKLDTVLRRAAVNTIHDKSEVSS